MKGSGTLLSSFLFCSCESCEFNDNSVPRIKDLLDFLLPFARAYSATQKKTPSQPSSASSSRSSLPTATNRQPQFKEEKPKQQSSSSHNKCHFCQEPGHFVYQCKQLIENSVPQRNKLVTEKKLCTNCLRSHPGVNCRSTKSCQKCKGHHHTLLCSSSSAATLHSSTFNNDLLPTVVIEMLDGNGHPHQCRGLVDSGSQLNLITDDLASTLKLPRTKSHISLSGTGSVSCGSNNGEVNIKARSLVNPSYSFNFNSIIMSNLTSDHPQKSISEDMEWNHLDSLPLADPSYREKGRIDFILGSGVCAQIKTGGFIRISPHEPIGEETELGWIVYGRTATTTPTSTVSTLLCVVDSSPRANPKKKFSSSFKLLKSILQSNHHHNNTNNNNNSNQLETADHTQPKMEIGSHPSSLHSSHPEAEGESSHPKPRIIPHSLHPYRKSRLRQRGGVY